MSAAAAALQLAVTQGAGANTALWWPRRSLSAPNGLICDLDDEDTQCYPEETLHFQDEQPLPLPPAGLGEAGQPAAERGGDVAATQFYMDSVLQFSEEALHQAAFCDMPATQQYSAEAAAEDESIQSKRPTFEQAVSSRLAVHSNALQEQQSPNKQSSFDSAAFDMPATQHYAPELESPRKQHCLESSVLDMPATQHYAPEQDTPKKQLSFDAPARQYPVAARQERESKDHVFESPLFDFPATQHYPAEEQGSQSKQSCFDSPIFDMPATQFYSEAEPSRAVAAIEADRAEATRRPPQEISHGAPAKRARFADGADAGAAQFGPGGESEPPATQLYSDMDVSALAGSATALGSLSVCDSFPATQLYTGDMPECNSAGGLQSSSSGPPALQRGCDRRDHSTEDGSERTAGASCDSASFDSCMATQPYPEETLSLSPKASKAVKKDCFFEAWPGCGPDKNSKNNLVTFFDKKGGSSGAGLASGSTASAEEADSFPATQLYDKETQYFFDNDSACTEAALGAKRASKVFVPTSALAEVDVPGTQLYPEESGGEQTDLPATQYFAEEGCGAAEATEVGAGDSFACTQWYAEGCLADALLDSPPSSPALGSGGKGGSSSSTAGPLGSGGCGQAAHPSSHSTESAAPPIDTFGGDGGDSRSGAPGGARASRQGGVGEPGSSSEVVTVEESPVKTKKFRGAASIATGFGGGLAGDTGCGIPVSDVEDSTDEQERPCSPVATPVRSAAWNCSIAQIAAGRQQEQRHGRKAISPADATVHSPAPSAASSRTAASSPRRRRRLTRKQPNPCCPPVTERPSPVTERPLPMAR